MTWLTFAISVVKLLTLISTSLREQTLIKQGEDSANAKALQQALADLAKANGVIAEFKTLDDAAIDRTIDSSGWYRD